MRLIHKQIELRAFDKLQDMLEEDRALLAAATQVAQQAYAPYSGFQVGAAVLLENGEVVAGSNQENMAYPSGLCAERVAVFAASSAFPDVPIRKIAIIARSEEVKMDDPVTPCGACRQVIAEYENKQGKPIQVLLGSADGVCWVADSILSLLPFSFHAEGLKKKR